MFCPQCEAEYRPGFTRCADCGVDLVDRLPEAPRETHEEMSGDVRLVKVLQTKDRSDVLSIQMGLDSAGIEYLLQGELMTSFRDPVVLLVREEDLERVRELLKEIHLNYSNSAFSPRKGH